MRGQPTETPLSYPASSIQYRAGGRAGSVSSVTLWLFALSGKGTTSGGNEVADLGTVFDARGSFDTG